MRRGEPRGWVSSFFPPDSRAPLVGVYYDIDIAHLDNRKPLRRTEEQEVHAEETYMGADSLRYVSSRVLKGLKEKRPFVDNYLSRLAGRFT